MTVQHEHSPQTCFATALIVEPAPAMARLLTVMLHDLGFHVIETKGPDEALTELESHESRIDLVITELSLPDLSGTKLASFICRRSPATSVILLCDHQVPARAPLSANTVLLEKPFTRDQLSHSMEAFAPSLN